MLDPVLKAVVLVQLSTETAVPLDHQLVLVIPGHTHLGHLEQHLLKVLLMCYMPQ